MVEDLRLRKSAGEQGQDTGAGGKEGSHRVAQHAQVRAKQMQVLDLERNILQVRHLLLWVGGAVFFI